MTAGVWFPLLVRNRIAVSPPWWGLATTISIASSVNSVLRLVSESIYRRRANRVELKHPPLFVIGHWRTGTTWLHELLVKDKRFAFPTTYQCMVPHHFLLSERWLNPLVDRLMPANRPMDNMQVGTQLPQEDEFALMNMGIKSPYLEWAFANRKNYYEEYLTLTELDPAEQEHWKNAFRWFVNRLTLANPNRLVLKSPGHTARVATLLELFPDARFIHIVRDPFSFIPSTIRMWTRMADALSLQTRQSHFDEDRILDMYERMYQQFEHDRRLLNEANFCEMRYEDLVASPIAEVEKIYEQLDLGDFEPARPAMENYLESIAGYEPNRHELPCALHEKISERCGDYLEKYGYVEHRHCDKTTDRDGERRAGEGNRTLV